MSEASPGRVWVTGAGGLIGNACVEVARAAGYPGRARPLMRAEIDLADFRAVERLFARESPTGVIHCAARSRSPACQADPAGARLQNVEVTRRLAELAAEVPMVFLSTDLVFDGRRDGANGGYREDDAVNPLSVYAETKVEAEAWVRRNPRHAIVRTSLNFGRSPSGPEACSISPVPSACRGTTSAGSWPMTCGGPSPTWPRRCGPFRWRPTRALRVRPTPPSTARSWPPCWVNRCPPSTPGCTAEAGQ